MGFRDVKYINASTSRRFSKCACLSDYLPGKARKASQLIPVLFLLKYTLKVRGLFISNKSIMVMI
jgi:hypothetical protein